MSADDHDTLPRQRAYPPPRPPGRLRTADLRTAADGSLYVWSADHISSNFDLAARCGAKCRHGGPCTNPRIRGRTRCRMHGGRSPGPADKDLHAEATRQGLEARRPLAGHKGAVLSALGQLERILLRRAAVKTTTASDHHRIRAALTYIRDAAAIYREPWDTLRLE